MLRRGYLLLVFVCLLTIVPLPHPISADATTHAQSRLFYRLRVTISSTADWAELTVLNPDGFLTLHVQGVAGETTYVGTQIDRVTLNQTLSHAQAGDVVQVTVDYALDAGATGQPLRLELKKGAINWTNVEVAVVVDGTPTPLTSLYHETTPRDPNFNTKQFDVDVTSLRGFAPQPLPLSGTTIPRMVWAFYYPWYTVEHWSSTSLQDLPLDQYASNSPLAQRRHIEQAQSAGIDGFISSWWGPGDYTDRNLSQLLINATKYDFPVMAYFETLNDGVPRGRDEIYDWLAYFIATYRDHPAYMTIDGKPVIVIWVSATVPLEVWEDVFASLHEKGLDAIYLAMGYDNLAALDVFDGLHEYNVFPFTDLETTMARVGRSTRYYHVLLDDSSPKIWAATVQPGYNDVLLPGRDGLVQDREDGAFYRRTFEAALASEPDWIFITTWNEWWEHTYIEPSELYGDQYLTITREYAERWKGE